MSNGGGGGGGNKNAGQRRNDAKAKGSIGQCGGDGGKTRERSLFADSQPPGNCAQNECAQNNEVID